MNSLPIRLAALAVLVAGCVALVYGSGLWSVGGATGTGGPITDARAVQWKDLLPDGTVASLPLDATSDFPDVAANVPTRPRVATNETGGDPLSAGSTPFPELKSQSSSLANPNAPRADLDGQRIALAGYMTPFNVLEGKTRTFLLVPYVGACIHVPAPPPNQVVLVETAEPVEVRPMWEPFRAVGKVSVESIDTGLAQVGYVMELDRMEPYDPAGEKLEGVRSINDGD